MKAYSRYQVFNHQHHQRTFDSIGQARAYAREAQEFSRVHGWPHAARFVVKHRGEIVFDATQEQEERQ